MKLIKGYAILSQKELNEALREEYKRGKDYGERDSKSRVESLERGLARKDKEIEKLTETHEDQVDKLNRTVEKLEATVETYEADRDEAREVVKAQMEAEDMKVMLETKKEGLDRREAKLKDREARLGEEEEGEYKRGYTDGMADGVRKISEVTAQDRENAMKVAMVAAASHSTPEVVKELNSNVKSLTAWGSDQEG